MLDCLCYKLLKRTPLTQTIFYLYTGAGINAMSFNDFLKRANEGVSLVQRFREYSKETNWSNGEVVTRGTIGCYGDGFLRPGFSYTDGIEYLYSKVVEYQESSQDLEEILSRDWMNKFASACIPRGMELNKDFLDAFRMQWQDAVFYKTLKEVQNDDNLHSTKLDEAFRQRKEEMSSFGASSSGYWENFLGGLSTKNATRQKLKDGQVAIASHLNLICEQIINFASEAYLYNERLPSELWHQPKPVDSVVDDFAVEAQGFANALTLSAAFGAGTLAFRLVNRQAADLFSAILGGFNIIIAFATMTSKY